MSMGQQKVFCLYTYMNYVVYNIVGLRNLTIVGQQNIAGQQNIVGHGLGHCR